MQNSWIHLRRKKRERVRQLRELPRASVEFLQATDEGEDNQKHLGTSTACEGNMSKTTEKESLPSRQDLESSEDGLNIAPPLKAENQEEHIETTSTEQPTAIPASSDESNNGKEESMAVGLPSLEIGQEWFLFKCVLTVKKEGQDFLVEMHWVEGQNRDLMNQLCTYLKNQIFRLVTT